MLIYVHSATVISFCLRECLWQKEREREKGLEEGWPRLHHLVGGVSLSRTPTLSLSPLSGIKSVLCFG